MKQTQICKLNLVERGDTFSPDALNENAQKVEQELTRLDGADAALEARADGLEGRVTALEVQKIFFGTVVYESSPQTVNLGFTPKAVLFLGRNIGNDPALAVGEKSTQYRNNPVLEIVENGFIVQTVGVTLFASSEHNFIAFA